MNWRLNMTVRTRVLLLALFLSGCGLQQDITAARTDIDATDSALASVAGRVEQLSDQIGLDTDEETSLEDGLATLAQRVDKAVDLIGDGADIEGNVIDYLQQRDRDLVEALAQRDSEIAGLKERLAAVEATKADQASLEELNGRVGVAEGKLKTLVDADLPTRMSDVERSAADNGALASDNSDAIRANASAIAGARADLAALEADQDDLADALADLEADLGGAFEVWGLHRSGTNGSRIHSGHFLSASSSSTTTATLLKSCDYSYIRFDCGVHTDPISEASLWSGGSKAGDPDAVIRFSASCQEADSRYRDGGDQVWMRTSGSTTISIANDTAGGGRGDFYHVGCINLP